MSNNEQFKNGLDQIWSLLRNSNTQNITNKAKADILDLFLEDEVIIDTPDQVEAVFNNIQTLVELKKSRAIRSDMKIKRDQIGNFLQETKEKYEKWWKQNGKEFFKQVKEKYEKEIKQNTQKSNTSSINQDKPQEEDQNTMYIKQRLLLDLITLDEDFDKWLNREELKWKFNNLWDNLPIGIKNNIQIPKTDQDKSIKTLSDKISQKLQLTTLPNKPLLLHAHIEDTKQDLINNFTVDAHFMDKKNLILESERNRIRDLSERKYRETNWIKKIGMFATDRRSQNNNLERSITQKTQTNNFIEQDATQARIDGNIGTYAQQSMMWIDHNNITKTTPFENEKINNISHIYLMWQYDSDPIKNKEKAIINLNYTFKNEPSLQSLQMGDMTGTDIMAQLDSIDIWAYKAQHNLDKINNNTNKIKINLIWLKKTSDSEELEGVRYDNFEKGGREKLAKILNLERWKKDLSGWAGIAGIGAKVWAGILFSTIFTPLWVVAGVTGLWTILAWAKARRDAIKEIAKTHEDAINLWMDEIEKRITEIEKNISNASRRQKTIKHFGMWSLHTANRQKQILASFRSMWSSGLLKPTQELIQSLQNNNVWAMGEVLARIDAGHLRKTQFISTSQWGRNQTAIERNNLMNELKKAAIRTPLSSQDSQGNPITITVSPTSTPDQWKTYRKTLQQDSSYQTTMEMLYQWYDTVEKSIKSNKISIAKNAAGNYVKTAAAMTLGGAVVWGIAGIDLGWSDTQHEVVKTIQPHEHTWYQLGKFDDANALHHTSGLDQVQHGQSITIQWEAAVDGIKAHSTDSFLQHFQEHINQTDKLISDSPLNDETKKVLQNAISDDQVKHIMEIAKNAWADDGNARLVVERWREGMENITEHLVKHNMNDITIKDITFDENTVKDLFIQKSWTGRNAANRSFEAIVNIVKDTKSWWTNTMSWSIPNWSRAPYTLPFSNTYAYTTTQNNTTQWSSQNTRLDNSDIHSNQTQTTKPRDNIYA